MYRWGASAPCRRVASAQNMGTQLNRRTLVIGPRSVLLGTPRGVGSGCGLAARCATRKPLTSTVVPATSLHGSPRDRVPYDTGC